MIKLFISVFIYLLTISCAKEQKTRSLKAVSDSLASKKSTERPTVKIANTKVNNITNSKFDLELLYGIWTVDNNGPHADFELTEKSYYVVDYDGDGTMPYNIKNNTIIVKYPDYNNIGIIKKAVKDTLVINWNNGIDVTYFTWKG